MIWFAVTHMRASLFSRVVQAVRWRPGAKHGDPGFILIVVISAIGLLALVAATFANVTRSHVRLASAAVESAAAEQLADGGVHLAVLDLVAGNQERGRPRRFAIDGGMLDCDAGNGNWLRISVQDEAGKVDLNAADERLLRALLSGTGIGAPDGPSADRILDFRDVDSVRRPQGAELQEYQAASRSHGPKNAPFAVIEELQQVLGFSAADVLRLRPHVTVYSAQSAIDPSSASHELIGILTRGYSQLVPAAGDETTAVSERELPGQLPAALAAASGRRFFTVRSQAHAGRAIFVREAVVEISSSRTRPFTFLRWRRGDQAELPAEPALGLRVCWQG